jgi:hypothetical protein
MLTQPDEDIKIEDQQMNRSKNFEDLVFVPV